jgi:branched-subunit amino acid transport protein
VSFLDDGSGGYLTLLLAGFLATEVWRWLGLVLGSRLDLDGAPFQWLRAVATALVAGLVTRMLLFPAGALAQVPVGVRLGAFAGGILVYALARGNLAAGVGGGAAPLLGAELLLAR